MQSRVETLKGAVAVCLLAALLAGCAETERSGGGQVTAAVEQQNPQSVTAKTAQGAAGSARNAYFGDLHVHTTYSMDAFQFGTLATPDDAYRYAQGEAIKHPAGFEVQLDRPLDFYAVTDHGFFLGVVRAGADTSTAVSKYSSMEPIHNLNAADNQTLDSIPTRNFREWIRGFMFSMARSKSLQAEVEDIMRSTWADEIQAADRHYQPGKFTTFAAYEFSTTKPDGGSLHRNVIFRDTDNLPAEPFSRLDSLDPADLWDWMDGLRAKGVASLAIPHNSNKSNGQMFQLTTWAGDPMTLEHNEQRIRNEPLVEITQVKGTSETHPALSLNDEWAGFEIDPYIAGGGPLRLAKPSGGYVRDALKNGLQLQDQGLGNPFKFGFIGSSDTHTGAGSFVEESYFAKVGLLDATPGLRGSVPVSDADLASYGLDSETASPFYVAPDGRRYLQRSSSVYGASGLAAVWAEENTRNAIYNAFAARKPLPPLGRVYEYGFLRAMTWTPR